MTSMARLMWAVTGPCATPVRCAQIPRAGRAAKFGLIHRTEPACGVVTLVRRNKGVLRGGGGGGLLLWPPRAGARKIFKLKSSCAKSTEEKFAPNSGRGGGGGGGSSNGCQLF